MPTLRVTFVIAPKSICFAFGSAILRVWLPSRWFKLRPSLVTFFSRQHFQGSLSRAFFPSGAPRKVSFPCSVHALRQEPPKHFLVRLQRFQFSRRAVLPASGGLIRIEAICSLEFLDLPGFLFTPPLDQKFPSRPIPSQRSATRTSRFRF